MLWDEPSTTKATANAIGRRRQLFSIGGIAGQSETPLQMGASPPGRSGIVLYGRVRTRHVPVGGRQIAGRMTVNRISTFVEMRLHGTVFVGRFFHLMRVNEIMQGT